MNYQLVPALRLILKTTPSCFRARGCTVAVPAQMYPQKGKKRPLKVEDHLIYKFIIIYIILFIRKGDLNLNYQVSQSRT
jgi:hypothetical protein